eukprot:4980613-Pyramimonas_sp.AAC.1
MGGRSGRTMTRRINTGLNLNGVLRFRYVVVFPRFVANPPFTQHDIETKTAHEIANTPFRSTPG